MFRRNVDLTMLCAKACAEAAPLPELVFMGAPGLMKPSSKVDLAIVKTPNFQDRLEVLKQCMIEYGGIGIAGPQIGWNERVFCFGLFEPSARYPELNPSTLPFSHWINPEVREAPDSCPSWFWEGCLSVPDLSGWVGRPDSVLVEGYDIAGTKQEMVLKGVAARVFQHEFDHLDGRLFPSRVKDPSHLVPNSLFKHKAEWAEGWPTAAARATPKGQLSWEE